jgi:O-antigen ligase
MTALTTTVRFDRGHLLRLADWLAAAVAIALPWSTSATGILIAAWLVVVLPTLDMASIRRELGTPAGGLPVLLWCLGVVGMLWADAGWSERLNGLGGFNRLLLIPLLLAHFRRSEHGRWIVFGFLGSVVGVLVVSFFLALTPGLTWRGSVLGVPVHDDIFQGSEFLICAFATLGFAWREYRDRRRTMALALIALCALFLLNFAFSVISRASLLVAPLLAALLGWREMRWKGVAGACVLLVIMGAGAWFASPSVRLRIHNSIEEIQGYRAADEATSIGIHLAFLKESLVIVSSAPILGHGTGTIHEQFRKVTAGGTGAGALAADNPHNQTFAVTIQLGLLGAVVLWAMWISHLLLFRGAGAVAWCGLVVVIENIVSSVVHSHLFDFNSGWLYVFGVGVLGGMVLRETDAHCE